MPRIPELQVLTANRLSDGRVIYLAEDGTWSENLDLSRLVRGEAEMADAERAGEKAVAERLVVEPYLIEVEREDDSVSPARLRERIRAHGPTTGNSLAALDRAEAS